MRAFPGTFATEIAKKYDITPVWVLRLTVNGIVYDLSDAVFTFPVGTAGGFTATRPWIARWGAVRESISGTLSEMQISDFSCSVLVDQDAADNIRYLAMAYPLEQAPAELYLWLDGLTSATPPQRMFVGYVKDVDLPDETIVELTIEDESTRLQKYIGSRISSEAFPLCDPDDVGKMIPIVYGSVERGVARCVDSGWVSSLASNILAASTMIDVSEVPGYSLANKVIVVEDEQMLITDHANSGSSGANNLAAASNGAVVSSSVGAYQSGTLKYANDGSRIGDRYSGSTIVENTVAFFDLGVPISPVDCIINLGGTKQVSEVHVYSYQDVRPPVLNPPADLTSIHAIRAFKVQVKYGAGWADVAGGQVTGNALVWRVITFPPVYTQQVRLYITDGGLNQDPRYAFIVEIEVYGPTAPVVVSTGPVKTISVLRGYNSTAAIDHAKGTVVIEQKTTPLVYLLADHPLDQIGTVLSRVRGINVDITADVTKYLGTAANQLSAYPGRAAITIPDYARVSNRIALALEGDVTANDRLHTHVASTGNATIINNINQAFGASIQVASVNLRGLSTNGVWTIFWGDLYWNFAAVGGTILTSTVSAVISCPSGSQIYFGGVLINGNTPTYKNATVSHTFSTTSEATAMQSSQIRIRVQIAEVAITQTQTSYDDIRNAQAGCSATRTGTYNTAAPTISIDKVPSGVTVTNTLQLTGNSVADIAIGDRILVDKTRNISTPQAVISDLLQTYCNDTSLVQVGTFPSTYALNGELSEYRRAIEWLDYLSFQCRAFFRKSGGVSRLIVRDVNPAVTGIIPACCLTDEGIKALAYKKAPVTDVINKVKVFYDRDWSASGKQSESYRQSTLSTDPASIAIYGEQEQPDLFMFDFVTSPAMAADLATFYQDFYADRKWRVSFNTYLDNAQYEFGDVAQLAFANDLVGTVVEAGIAPGSIGQMDKMQFVVETVIIPIVDAEAVTTLLGDQLMTKDRERIIYA